MLGDWSWQDFGLLVTLLSLVWYGGLCWYYRTWWSGLLGRKKVLVGSAKYLGPPKGGGSSPAVAGTGQDVGLLPREAAMEEESVMGAAKLPEGMAQLGSGDFGFVGMDDEGKSDALGLVADVLEELKGLLADLAAGDGQKRDFLLGLESIKGRYPRLSGHPRLGQLNAFILENVPFLISREELEGLWD